MTFDDMIAIHEQLNTKISQKILFYRGSLTSNQLYVAFKLAEEYRNKLPIHTENDIEKFFASFGRTLYLRDARISDSIVYQDNRVGIIRRNVFFPGKRCDQQIKDDMRLVGQKLFEAVEDICNESGICFFCGRFEEGIGGVCRRRFIRR